MADRVIDRVISGLPVLSRENEMPLLYTVDQAAEILGMSRKYVYDMMHRIDEDGMPVLRHLKIGRSYRITRDALESLIDGICEEHVGQFVNEMANGTVRQRDGQRKA